MMHLLLCLLKFGLRAILYEWCQFGANNLVNYQEVDICDINMRKPFLWSFVENKMTIEK